jgi:Transposase DDE domain
MMLDRIVEVFCEVDDFCQAFVPQWEASLLGPGGPAPRGPQPGLSPSEIITLLLTVQASNISRAFITASPSRWLLSRHALLRALRQPAEKCLRAAGILPRQPPGNQDRALLHRLHRPCDNHRINRHKVFAGLAQRGKTSMGWFFGFKLHLVFNTDNEIVALKLTPGNDTTPVPALTRELTGKLFGDKGYIGQKLAEDLLRRGLTLFTRVRRNMKSLPLSLQDKALLNARNMAEIGHIKEFSSLNLSKHRSVINAFVHIIAAITAYQINPFKPKRNLQPRYQLETTA